MLHSAAVASIKYSDPVVVETTKVALGYCTSPSGKAGPYKQP